MVVVKPDAFAALERDIGAGENGKQMGHGGLAHGGSHDNKGWTEPASAIGGRRGPKIKVPPSRGGTEDVVLPVDRLSTAAKQQKPQFNPFKSCNFFDALQHEDNARMTAGIRRCVHIFAANERQSRAARANEAMQKYLRRCG